MKKLLFLPLVCCILLVACSDNTVQADYRKMMNSLELGKYDEEDIISSGTTVELEGKITRITENLKTPITKSSDRDDAEHESFILKESNHLQIEDSDGDTYVIVTDSIDVNPLRKYRCAICIFCFHNFYLISLI
ncbi:hypothetical protein ACFQ4N_09855 [Oceanobacillus iheyensis]|uniref:hypothetical protein n=1 Tax=Oceanobacillus iheyensis TaxID=182710 RepID=UPI00362A26F4